MCTIKLEYILVFFFIIIFQHSQARYPFQSVHPSTMKKNKKTLSLFFSLYIYIYILNRASHLPWFMNSSKPELGIIIFIYGGKSHD
jgi:hypothetical protein